MKTFFTFVSVLLVASLIYAKSVDPQENEVDDIGRGDKLRKTRKWSTLGNGLAEDRGRLITFLLDNGYDKRNYPTNMTVKFGLALLNLDIDEKRSTLEADVWIRTTWSDKRLSWDKKEFDVDVIRMRPDQIWHPDTTLYNSAVLPNMMHCSETNVLIYSTGEILWVPPCHLSSFCNLTLATEPYGAQQCRMVFGSWTFDGISMDLQVWKNETKADTNDYSGVSQWDLTSNVAVREDKYYDCCVEPYPSITYNFTLQRKPVPRNVACHQ